MTITSTVNMEEREALKREIELLQNLIDKHKSIHGDTPFASVQQRLPEAPTSARGCSTSIGHPHTSRGSICAPQSRGSWRRTYSLRNKNPLPSTVHPFSSTSSSGCMSVCTSLPSHSRGEESVKDATLPSGISRQSINTMTLITMQKINTDPLRKTGTDMSQHKEGPLSSTLLGHDTIHRLKTRSNHVVLPDKKCSAPIKTNTSDSLQNKHLLMRKTEAKCTVTTAAANMLPNVSKPPSDNLTSHRHASENCSKKSKFVWVKNQNVGGVEPKQVSNIFSHAVKAATASSTSAPKAGAATGSTHVFSVSKRSLAKKPCRKLSQVVVSPKTSKYKWVSSSAAAQAKIARKSLSPKALTSPQRVLGKGDATKKARAASSPFAKIKKEVATSSTSNPYCWKAGSHRSSTTVTAGGAVDCRRSAFKWTSEKNKGLRGGSSPGTQRFAVPSSSSTGAFKLHSRMKIVRKSAISGGGSEKVSSTPAVKFSPRGRSHISIRSPTGARRTPSRELVSFGRHKLSRLSTSFTRTSPYSSSSFRDFGSHYRTCSSAVHTPHYNPTLSWRAKKVQSARSFLQSRMRVVPYSQSSSTQHWRGSSICWIRGSLYQVSANKLSRTTASTMTSNQTGRSCGTAQDLSVSTSNRSSNTRHLANRAVQRSLSVIRHACQKKQLKQYCMYYNRFGKCNRGDNCPYIHDPDKVAVCTRFLRGMCKQADGTCPFSHKVAKEKMPVCSYFLKGLCTNNDCPYSHVYVSRKAEVCMDFVKGYCPDGEKCKKKHTLVCPDFLKTGSCPRGPRCKLQHRQRRKRTSSNTDGAAIPAKRPQLSIIIKEDSQAAPGMPVKGPLELPSFIALSSSPEEADAPDALAEMSQVKEKKLQIKPRL